MCIHPRCGLKPKFRMKNTELGSRIDLCEVHKEVYEKRYPEGKILILGVDHDPDDHK